jgi:hypothetical protein
MKDDIAYHRARASHELDLGLTSTSMAAARSHLKLSSLHMERLRKLADDGAPERPPFFVA